MRTSKRDIQLTLSWSWRNSLLFKLSTALLAFVVVLGTTYVPGTLAYFIGAETENTDAFAVPETEYDSVINNDYQDHNFPEPDQLMDVEDTHVTTPAFSANFAGIDLMQTNQPSFVMDRRLATDNSQTLSVDATFSSSINPLNNRIIVVELAPGFGFSQIPGMSPVTTTAPAGRANDWSFNFLGSLFVPDWLYLARFIQSEPIVQTETGNVFQPRAGMAIFAVPNGVMFNSVSLELEIQADWAFAMGTGDSVYHNPVTIRTFEGTNIHRHFFGTLFLNVPSTIAEVEANIAGNGLTPRSTATLASYTLQGTTDIRVLFGDIVTDHTVREVGQEWSLDFGLTSMMQGGYDSFAEPFLNETINFAFDVDANLGVTGVHNRGGSSLSSVVFDIQRDVATGRDRVHVQLQQADLINANLQLTGVIPTSAIAGTYRVIPVDVASSSHVVPFGGTNSVGNVNFHNHQSQAITVIADVVYHEVTFDFNYAGLPNKTVAVAAGQVVTPVTTPVRTGYTFTNWYLDATLTTIFDFTTAITDTLTLYAGWEAIVVMPVYHEVTFDFNYTGLPNVTVDVAAGQVVTPVTTPVRTGYTFTNWYLDATLITIFDFTTPITGAVTLYAGWEAIVVIPVYYEVMFNFNYAGLPNPTVNVQAGQLIPPIAIPTRAGFTFTNWFTTAELTTVFDFTQPITGAVTLYAGWVANQVTVNFNANNGVQTPSITVTFGRPYGALPQPTRAGHHFVGWFTATVAGVQITEVTTVTNAQTHTLFARWERDLSSDPDPPRPGLVAPPNTPPRPPGNQNPDQTPPSNQPPTPNNPPSGPGSTPNRPTNPSTSPNNGPSEPTVEDDEETEEIESCIVIIHVLDVNEISVTAPDDVAFEIQTDANGNQTVYIPADASDCDVTIEMPSPEWRYEIVEHCVIYPLVDAILVPIATEKERKFV